MFSDTLPDKPESVELVASMEVDAEPVVNMEVQVERYGDQSRSREQDRLLRAILGILLSKSLD